MLGLQRIPSFREFLDEKMSVIVRNLYTEVDEYGVSVIVNEFMENISDNPNDEYETAHALFDTAFGIKYRPNKNTTIHGETKSDYIYIYTYFTPEKYLEIKYTLVHEITHMIHQILSDNERPYEDLDSVGKLRHKLIRTNIENMSKKYQYLSYILYAEDRNETLARNQNAYMWSFKTKKEHADFSNNQIIDNVFRKLQITTAQLKIAIGELKKYENAFDFIIILLVGHFNEFGKSGIIRYFDKNIYQIPFIKEMRQKIRDIINDNYLNYDKMQDEVLELISKNEKNFYKYKSEIIDSFIKHFKYNFENMRKRMSKSIQLGIDDATETLKLEI